MLDKVTIEKTVKRYVKKYLKEAMSEQFSFDKLKSISSFRGRLNYCLKTLGYRIGTGSSRICFQLDDNKILKLAINAKGIAQNNVENRVDNNLDSLGVRPEIYDETDYENNWFIVCEYVLPARKADFKQTCGLSWEEFSNFVYDCYAEKEGWTARHVDWDAMYEMMEENDKLYSIHEYIAN